MRDLSSSDLLALWERGHSLHPLDRGLLVLDAALPGTTCANLADWPIGRRNRALVQVRCACFGTQLEGWTSCVACGEKLELDMDGRMIVEQGDGPEPARDETVEVNGRSFRLPTSRDLAKAITAEDPRKGAMLVAESCIVERAKSVTWSDEELEQVGASMAMADPMAEILLEMRCPVCGHQGESTLDILAFFWAELESMVKRLLADVHDLAAAYGWGEGEILSLSDRRRSLYLEMVRE